MRTLIALLLILAAPLAQAFDLDDLAAQLARPAAVAGSFVQQRYLRALPQPLTSSGHFTLARGLGLLWQLEKPLTQTYRITPGAIAKETPAGWTPLPGSDLAARQSALFLAVLGGDRSGLERDFELALSGDAGHWQLRLTPRGALLKQVFDGILIQGGELVEQVEIRETQGDRSLLRLDGQARDALSADQRAAFQ